MPFNNQHTNPTDIEVKSLLDKVQVSGLEGNWSVIEQNLEKTGNSTSIHKGWWFLSALLVLSACALFFFPDKEETPVTKSTPIPSSDSMEIKHIDKPSLIEIVKKLHKENKPQKSSLKTKSRKTEKQNTDPITKHTPKEVEKKQQGTITPKQTVPADTVTKQQPEEEIDLFW